MPSPSAPPLPPALPEIVPADRRRHLDWLLDITQIPTAAGREWRVVEWIRRWVAERPALALREDGVGNLVVEPKKPWKPRGRKAGASSPVFITAHLDHPAFVVERVVGPGTLELSFRGGVMDRYFPNARVVVHAGGRGGEPEVRLGGTIVENGSGAGTGDQGQPLFKTYVVDLDEDAPQGTEGVRVGDVGTWALPPSEVDQKGIVHTPACDDLAAAAAALSAMDVLLRARGAGAGTEDVRLLFTRSEEIGFTGAIAACRLRTMPRGARVVALENSRAFPESPIGGGPIVRVGDRMSVFSPRLTSACAARAEQAFRNAAAPTATQRQEDLRGRPWQRKLMAGGACEATVFCAYGYEATCLCLPLGNYHNMADLAEVQAGTYDEARLGPPRIARECISAEDYHGLVDLLVAIGVSLPEQDPALPRIERLYATREFVLREERGGGDGRAGNGKAPRSRPGAKRARPIARKKTAKTAKASKKKASPRAKPARRRAGR